MLKLNINDPKYWSEIDWDEPKTSEILKRTDTQVEISRRNRLNWADPKKKEQRKNSIKKVREEQSILNDDLRKEIYFIALGPTRRSGLIDELSISYKVSKNYIKHIINNSQKLVSDEDHILNMKNWEAKYGFGIWEIMTPGVDLIDEYDKTISNSFPCSIVWKIRFKMKDNSPKEIRDILLPYTNGKYITNKSGKIENGRYLNIRNKYYPFLTEEKSNKIIIDNSDDMQKWLSKIMGRNITKIYMFQILNSNPIKKIGSLSGYKFTKLLDENGKTNG